MSVHSMPLRVVAFREGETWVAQCLDVDIATQAADFDTLMKRIKATIEAEASISGSAEAMAADIGPAPDYFQAMWDAQTTVLSPFDQVELAIAA